MRARSLKSALFANEILGSADPILTILFQGLWCIADREGRLEDRPARIKALVFPYRDGLNIDPLLDWLHAQRLIARYQLPTGKFIQVVEFKRHQRPHKNEVNSVIGAWNGEFATKVVSAVDQGDKRFALTPDSGLLTPDCGILTAGVSVASPPHSRKREPAAVDPVVQRVFDHWKITHQHQRAALDEKRENVIARMLKLYDERLLCDAISGYRNSPHHMGQNDRNTVYDDIELLLRDASQVDAGLRFLREPPRTGDSKNLRRNIAAVADWVPPEIRNAGK